jgi:hypothetical protein
MMRHAWSAVLLLLSLGPAACYSYRPLAEPRPGMDVRARLTTEAALKRSQGMDDPIVRLDGTIVAATASSLSLDILVARTSSAFLDVEIRDTVQLDLGEVQSIQSRRFSPLKTAVFVAGVGAAAFGVVKGIDQIVGGTEDLPDDGTPTSPPPARVSWRSVRTLLGLLRR